MVLKNCKKSVSSADWNNWWYKINDLLSGITYPKDFLYNTALSAQLPSLASLNLYQKMDIKQRYWYPQYKSSFQEPDRHLTS